MLEHADGVDLGNAVEVVASDAQVSEAMFRLTNERHLGGGAAQFANGGDFGEEVFGAGGRIVKRLKAGAESLVQLCPKSAVNGTLRKGRGDFREHDGFVDDAVLGAANVWPPFLAFPEEATLEHTEAFGGNLDDLILVGHFVGTLVLLERGAAGGEDGGHVVEPAQLGFVLVAMKQGVQARRQEALQFLVVLQIPLRREVGLDVVMNDTESQPAQLPIFLQLALEPLKLRLAQGADMAGQLGVGLLAGLLAVVAVHHRGVQRGDDDFELGNFVKGPRLDLCESGTGHVLVKLREHGEVSLPFVPTIQSRSLPPSSALRKVGKTKLAIDVVVAGNHGDAVAGELEVGGELFEELARLLELVGHPPFRQIAGVDEEVWF